MVKKRELRQRIGKLEDQVTFLRAQLEKKDLTIIEKDKVIRTLEKELGMKMPRIGEVTELLRILYTVNHYLFDEGENPEAAEPWLDQLFEMYGFKEKKRVTLCIYENRDRKKILSLTEKVQKDIELKSKWLLLRYENDSAAGIPYAVYKRVLEDRKVMENEKLKERLQALPNLAETKRSGKYLVPQEILGPDLFYFFRSLEEKPDTPAKRVLVDLLLKKQLADTAYIRTGEYGLDKSLIIYSSHEDKILEVFEEAKIPLKEEEKEKLTGLMKPINARAVYPMRDSASWNFKLKQEQADYFLSDYFLFQKKPDSDEIGEVMAHNLYAYDFDKLVRMTFQSDEAIHTLEWPVPSLSQEEKGINEEFFVRKLTEYGEDTRSYWELRTLEGFYRHARMWLFYRRNQENYPDPEDKFKQHHLEMAFKSLYLPLFGKEPSREELAEMSLEKILQLVMHPDCRA